MANTTPLVTIVTKPTINPAEANSAPRVNIQEFCEEHYEDILPIIMEKVRHDRRKDVHTRLDFGEGPRERVREDSYSNVRARASEPGRVKVQDRLKYGSRHVLDRLGHRRQSAFNRLSDTYSPSTTKSHPQRMDSKDSPRGRDTPQIKGLTFEVTQGGERGSNRFTPLTKTPKEILATEASKFQPQPPMVTLVEKRSSNKFCDFHNDKGHSTDECMQLKKKIEELVRAGKLSHLIKEIKQGRDQSKIEKKETAAKDKPTAIYMVQSWQRTIKQKVTQSVERVREIAFPQLTASNGMEGPLVIEVEMGGHVIHRMYIDGSSSMEILYEHCFNRLRPEIKSQMVPATTSL
nr:reverse transcriptase domain-containing protein [Tanacetum cinerariifolium]